MKVIRPQSKLTILSHDLYWVISIAPLTQAWIVDIYSLNRGYYVEYATTQFIPLNTWCYFAMTLSDIELTTYSYPAFASTKFTLDRSLHPVWSGASTDFYVLETISDKKMTFDGFIHTIKYWNKVTDISSNSIQYPSNTPGIIPDGLTHFYIMTYAYYDPFNKAKQTLDNLASSLDESMVLPAGTKFASMPSFYTEAPNFANNVCEDHGYYTKFENSYGLIASFSMNTNKFLIETWVYLTDTSQVQSIAKIDSAGVLKFDVTSFTNSFQCHYAFTEYSNYYANISPIFSNIWQHIICAIDGSALKVTAKLYTGVVLSANTASIDIAPSQGIYKMIIGNSLNGYIREFRLWNTIPSDSSISTYRYQALDAYDTFINSSMLLYYPFNTETDMGMASSGLNASFSYMAVLISSTEHNKIYYTDCDTDLVICPVGHLFDQNNCVIPKLYLEIIEENMDYLVRVSSNLNKVTDFYSFDWSYPSIIPLDADFITYITGKIGTLHTDSFSIFKPALKYDRLVNVSVAIKPLIYSNILQQLTLTDGQTMYYKLNCPTISLGKDIVLLSNFVTSDVVVLAEITTCDISYVAAPIVWNLQGQTNSLFFTTLSSGSTGISILQSQFTNYDIGTVYTIDATSSISLQSPEGVTYDYTLSSSMKVVRDSYSFTFASDYTKEVSPFDSMKIYARHDINKHSSYSEDLEPVLDKVECSNNFPLELCNQILFGLDLAPYERVTYGIQSKTYTFKVKGSWRGMTTEDTFTVEILRPNYFIENMNVPAYYDYITYQLTPVDDSNACIISEIAFKWYYYGDTNILSSMPELKLNKSDIFTTVRLVAEIRCDNKVVYDFVELYKDTTQFAITVDNQYSFASITESLIVHLEDLKPSSYMLAVGDIVDDAYVPAQALYPSKNEIKILLPYTSQIQISKYNETSIKDNFYKVTMLNSYAINIDNYISKYTNNNDFTNLMYLIMHVRNKRESFTEKQRLTLLKYISAFNGKTSTFLELTIVALKQLGSQLDNSTEYVLWLDALSNCIALHNNFLCASWSNIIKSVSQMLSNILMPFIRNVEVSSTRIELTQKTKTLIAFLQDFIIEQLIPYESYTMNSEMFSLGGYMFSNYYTDSIISQILLFPHAQQSAVFSLSLDFISEGIESNEKAINSISKFALIEATYNIDSLFNDSLVQVDYPTSKAQVNLSLYSYDGQKLSRLPQTQSIINQKFRPVTTFSNLSWPEFIEKSQCYCSNIDAENSTCRTRLDAGSSTVFCTSGSSGLTFVSIEYSVFIEAELIWSVITLIIYVAVFLAFWFGLLILSEWMDKKDAKSMSDYPKDVEQVEELLISKQLSTHKCSYSLCGCVWLVFKFFHPFIEIFTVYTPISPRFSRFALLLLVVKGISALIYWLVKSNAGATYWDVLPSFWFSLILSIALWIVYMIFVGVVTVIMKKAYAVEIIMLPQTEENTNKEKEMQEGQKNNMSPEVEKCFSPKEDNSESIRDEVENPEMIEDSPIEVKGVANAKAQVEEGIVTPIDNPIYPASYLSMIINSNGRYIGDTKYVNENGESFIVKNPNVRPSDGTRAYANLVGQQIKRPASLSSTSLETGCQSKKVNESQGGNGFNDCEHNKCCSNNETKMEPTQDCCAIKEEEKKAEEDVSARAEGNNISKFKEEMKQEETIVFRAVDNKPSLPLEAKASKDDSEERPSLISFEDCQYRGFVTDVGYKSVKEVASKQYMTEMQEQPELIDSARPMSNMKTHSILSMNLYRDYVLVLIAIVIASCAMFYVSSTLIETRLHIVEAWILLATVVVLAILFVWNSLYIIVMGLLAYWLMNTRSSNIKKILKLLVLKSIQTMMIDYSLRC